MAIRVLRALTVLAIAFACGMVWSLEPHLGSVYGVCVDSKTGHPIPHAWIYLSATSTSSDNDTSSSTPAPGDVTDDLGSTDAPFGWAQGASDDSAGELKNQSPTSNPEARADENGRFVIAGVPEGSYSATVSARGYDTNDTQTVNVDPDASSNLSVSLDKSDASLSFQDTTGCWLPGENAVVGLNGNIAEMTVQMTLYKANIDSVVSQAPSVLLTSRDYGGTEGSTSAVQLSKLRSWTVTLKSDDNDSEFYQRIQVGKLDEGFYEIEASGGGTSTTGWIDVTRLAMIRKLYHDRVLAFVTDLQTGAPQAGIPLELLGSDAAGAAPIAQAVTDANGLADISFASAKQEGQGVLIARRGGSMAAVSLEMNSPGETAEVEPGPSDADDANPPAPYSVGALRAFVYTDRPIYRPGQTIYFKGIARFFNGVPDNPAALEAPNTGDANPTALDTGLSIPAGQKVTVDIKDAQETLVSHQELTTNTMGSWNGQLAVSTEALTGEYTIRASIGGQSVEGNFTVAAYHKPEYQDKVTFDRPHYVRGDTIKATITATYYYGAPLAGAKLDYFVSSNDSQQTATEATPFDPNLMQSTQPSTPSGSSVINGSIRLDDHGQAVLTVPTPVDKEDSQDDLYSVDATVSDASGRSIDDDESVVVSQGEFSLGVNATPYSVNPGTSVSITVTASKTPPAAANEDDEEEEGGDVVGDLPNQPIEVMTAYETWSKGQERLSGITTQSLKTDADGEITLASTPSHGGLFLVRAKSTDTRGNAISSETTVWVTSQDADLQIQYPEMALLLDKPKYMIGDTAKALINTDHPGTTALVTIEGATLYRAWTVPLPKHTTSVDIPVIAEYSPGVTISVCGISGKQYLSSSQPLTIDEAQRALKIAVTGDKPSYHPGDPATISIATTDAAGVPVPAEVSVGVVDSAIYAIKEDDTDIGAVMTPDQGNIVDTDYSCPPLYLGDVDKGSMQIKLRTKFPDTAYWNPTVQTGSDGKATVQLTLPDNLTKWRVTCVGHSLSNEMGEEKVGSLQVSQDLVARLETPNFLIAGDQSTLTGVVNNNSSQPVKASVSLDAGGLTLKGAQYQTVDVPAGGSMNVQWPVTASAPGDVDLKMRAWTANGLSDGVEQPISTLPHASHDSIWQSGSLTHFVDKTVTLDPDALPASTMLRVRLSPTISSALVPAWKFLSEYPYGAVDTTADTLIGDSVLGMNRAAIPIDPTGTQPRPLDRLPDETTRGVLRLARFQKDDGGWGWFPNGKSDFWMTAYATYALLLARDAGYPSTPAVIDGALKQTAALAEQRMAANSSYYDYGMPSSLALSALVLARAGNVKTAAKILDFLEQRRIHPRADENDDGIGDLAACVIAAHYLPDYQAKSARWMDELWSKRQFLGDLTAWPVYPHTESMGADQEAPDAGSTAWAMLAAETVNASDPRIDGVARWVMANRTGDYWYCPLSTAVTLMALGPYISEAHEAQPDFEATVTVNGHVVTQTHFGSGSTDQPDVAFDLPATSFGQTAAVHLEKSGQGRLYYSLELRESKAVGTPPSTMSVWQRWYDRVWHPDRLEAPFEPSGYRITRVYLRNTSRRNAVWEDTVPDRAHDFQVDDDVIVRLIIDSTRAGSHLIVEEPVPAGCDISEVSADEAEDWDNWWDYTDVRDDKIVFFIGDLTRGRHEIDYHLRAASPGRYDVMPTSITASFDPTLHVEGKADRITVE